MESSDHLNAIVSDDDGIAVDPVYFCSVFKFQYTPWTDFGTDATSDTGRPHDVLSLLRIGTHIYAHFTIGGAIAAGNALTSVGGNSKPAFKTLNDSEDRGQWTAETAPDAASHQWIKSGADHTRKNRSYKESIPFLKAIRGIV